MGGKPLSTRASATQARTHVPLSVDALLSRAEFADAGKAQQKELGIEVKNGDRLLIRTIGFFAVRVYLPHRARKALVWMGLHNGTGMTWKAPKPHPDNYLAALDAYNLIKSLTFDRVAGD